ERERKNKRKKKKPIKPYIRGPSIWVINLVTSLDEPASTLAGLRINWGALPIQRRPTEVNIKQSAIELPNTDPSRMSRPTSGSRNPPASRRLQAIILSGHCRRTNGSSAMYISQKNAEKNKAP